MKKILLCFSLIAIVFLAKAQNPYPIIPIDTVQFVNDSKLSQTFPNDSSDYINPFFKNSTYRDTVRFEGIVMFDPRFYGLSTSRKATVLMADTNGGPWKGVEIMCEPAGTGRTLAQLLNETKFYDNLKPGNKVRVTGVIRTFRGTAPAGTRQGQSQVNMISASPLWENGAELIDLNTYKVKPIELKVDSLMTGNASAGQVQQKLKGEKYEGSFVELKNVTVFSRQASGSRWFWSVADEAGNAIDVGDFSGWYRNDNNSDSTLPAGRFTPPLIGTRLSFIRGVIVESAIGGQYRFTINPLMPGDVGPSSYTPPTVSSRDRQPVIAKSTDSVAVIVKVQQGTVRVSNVKLFHTVGYTSTTFDSVTLTRNVFPNDTMVWFGYIPARANGSVVKYFVRPTDINGSFTSSPDAFGSFNAYVVNNSGVSSIQDLQFSPYPNNQTIWNNDSISGVDIRGVVTATAMTQGTTNILTIQNGTALNSAIIVNRRPNDPTGTWRVGDSVSLTAFRIIESFGMTTLNNIAGTRISAGATLPGFVTMPIDTIAAISASATRRPELAPYEGMLMKFDSVFVVNPNADAPSNFGEFAINKDSSKTTGLRVDDISTRLPDNFNVNLVKNQFMSSVKGIFTLTFSNWKLQPRDSNDLDFSGAPDTEKPVITLLGKNPDSLLVNTSYVDAGATAIDNKDGDITSKIMRFGTVDSSKVGSFLVLYTVKDKAGNRDTITRTVIVYSKVGINDNELVFANTSIFPNPAQETLHINVSGYATLPLTVSIVDISGRTLFTEAFHSKQVNTAISTSQLNNGIYFLNLSTNGGSKTIKFVVNH
jgi:hypothetical protein